MIQNLGVCQKKKSKTMPVNGTSLWDAYWVALDVPNGTVGGVDKGRGDVDKVTVESVVNWTVTNLEGSDDVRGGGDVSGGFWWEEEGTIGDIPTVKFGPDPGLLKAVGVCVNFLVFVAAAVLTIAVVCRCVSGKVRISLNRRSGPEIAFNLGARSEEVDRVVVAGIEDRCHGRDGERDGGPNRHTL